MKTLNAGKVAAKVGNAKTAKQVVPKATPAPQGDPGTPLIRAGKVTNNGKTRVAPALKTEAGKIEPTRDEKVKSPKAAAKPTGKTPTGVVKPAKQPVLKRILEGKGYIAELINKAELNAQEKKDWEAADFDTCQMPKCTRPSVYVVERADAGPEEDDINPFCIPCTLAKLGLKK